MYYFVTQRSYLPTMQEDAILDVKDAMIEIDQTGRFYGGYYIFHNSRI
jgi:hypothetical protein